MRVTRAVDRRAFGAPGARVGVAQGERSALRVTTKQDQSAATFVFQRFSLLGAEPRTDSLTEPGDPRTAVAPQVTRTVVVVRANRVYEAHHLRLQNLPQHLDSLDVRRDTVHVHAGARTAVRLDGGVHRLAVQGDSQVVQQHELCAGVLAFDLHDPLDRVTQIGSIQPLTGRFDLGLVDAVLRHQLERLGLEHSLLSGACHVLSLTQQLGYLLAQLVDVAHLLSSLGVMVMVPVTTWVPLPGMAPTAFQKSYSESPSAIMTVTSLTFI